MQKYFWVVLILAAAACSDASSNPHGQGRGGNLSGAGAGGSGNGNGSGGTGDLGNSNGNGGSTGNLNVDAGDGCEVGKFCAPTVPDPDNCGSLTLESDVKTVEMPGNVLMIFDRSLSMNDNWDASGGMTKWQAAGSAMISALMPLQDKLTIGSIFYPDTSGTSTFVPSCTVAPISDQDQIDFLPGAMALAKMQAAAPSGTPTPLYAAIYGQTPTLEALQAADAALTGATLSGTTVVILVTDGDPTCAWNQGTAISLVTAWAAKGIKTYALGVPGVGGTGEANLNAIAQAGGTTMYIPPTDAATLQKTIQDIVVSTVKVGFDSCTINLTPPAMVPEKLHLIVKQNGMEADVPHEFMTGEKAWTITPDGKTVELVGNLCEAAKNATYESIRFEFGCVELPPAPPPPVPQ